MTNAARLAVNTLIWFGFPFFAVHWYCDGPDRSAGRVRRRGRRTASTGSWTAFPDRSDSVNFLGLGVSAKSGDSGITASASFNVLQILVISGAVGIAALKVGEAAKPFIDVVKSALAIIQKILWWDYSPGAAGYRGSGSLRLCSRTVGRQWVRWSRSLSPTLACYWSSLVVYPIIVRANGLSVRQYFGRVAGASAGLRVPLFDGFDADDPDRCRT